LWQFLKGSLPKDYVCLYEPLQLKISTAIQREKNEKTKDPLIKEFLWQEYINLGEYELLRVLRNHPSSTNDGIMNEKALESYFDRIDKLYPNILLQPNRLHFFLDLFKQRYNSKIIHIIRNPLDVYLSIINVDRTIYENTGKQNKIKYYFSKTIKTIYPQIRSKLGEFEVDKDLLWIKRHIGLPYLQEYSWRLKFFSFQSYFEKMIIVWILTNYYAIKTINQEKGYLLVYEELITKPNKVTKDLEKYLEIKINTPPNVKKGNYNKFEKNMIQKMMKVVTKNKLEKEFQFILDEVRTRGINYI
jgi:hypothetical protein